MSTVVDEFRTLLRKRGFIESDAARLTPLTGGVSSEIYLVTDGDHRFVVKRALAKLKVDAEWFADTSRNRLEQEYMRYVGSLRPDSMPEIDRSDSEAGLFSMEYLDGFRNWKQDLLDGNCDAAVARSAGELLGVVHARSWGDEKLRQAFDARSNFDQLRIDPYLRTCADLHPRLAAAIHEEADRLLSSQQCLIHGDYSPKNMLYRDQRLVPLDCEVACFADAAFDLSVLLSHLLLKSLFHTPLTEPFQTLAMAVRSGYANRNPTHAEEVENNAARLLPLLMLARVDGKSPVEYLSPDQQQFVRLFVGEQLDESYSCLDRLTNAWFHSLS